MHKYACYCVTRNIYDKVIPSLKSLLKNSDVDTVYILAEDPAIGHPLPLSRVKVIDVSGQTYFPPTGPNFTCQWTYMVMMRVALCHILPDVDKILSLDCDTIVREDISDLWNWDLRDDYFAAAQEIHRDFHGQAYHNCGVVMWNLKQMRDGKADEVIRALNTRRYQFCEQDALNALCAGRIQALPSMYNVCRFTKEPWPAPKIRHHAAEGDWYNREAEVRYWKDLPWKEVLS